MLELLIGAATQKTLLSKVALRLEQTTVATWRPAARSVVR